ncbi:MAG: hypothetical protein WC872_01970 [Candidatus Absconditabacterales bacterium]|jgi:hypothetical protein
MKEKSELKISVFVLGNGQEPVVFNEDRPFLSKIEIVAKTKTLVQKLLKKQMDIEFDEFIKKFNYKFESKLFLWSRLSDPKFDIYDYVKLEEEAVNFLFIITTEKGLFPISEIFGNDFDHESTKLIHVIRRYRKRINKNDRILYFVGLGNYNNCEGIHIVVNPEKDSQIKKIKNLEGKVINLPNKKSKTICLYHKELKTSISNLLKKSESLNKFDCCVLEEDEIPKDFSFAYDQDMHEIADDEIEIEGTEIY